MIRAPLVDKLMFSTKTPQMATAVGGREELFERERGIDRDFSVCDDCTSVCPSNNVVSTAIVTEATPKLQQSDGFGHQLSTICGAFTLAEIEPVHECIHNLLVDRGTFHERGGM